ncbi:Uncharacterised protein [Serratia rubidaea]|uniref:Uncharacterized protein n=1 Tax=Serratia rubidaea TaxID=61652 RepID=A0A4U9H845_SERRU|nr:Uncharacterised protein [Serratia rubidaea]
MSAMPLPKSFGFSALFSTTTLSGATPASEQHFSQHTQQLAATFSLCILTSRHFCPDALFPTVKEQPTTHHSQHRHPCHYRPYSGGRRVTACCDPLNRLPGAGWRGPQATARRSVAHLHDRGWPLHDRTGPGRAADAGERGRSNAAKRSATPCSQTTPGGHQRPSAEAVRPTSFGVFSQTMMRPTPPGTAATPDAPRGAHAIMQIYTHTSA